MLGPSARQVCRRLRWQKASTSLVARSQRQPWHPRQLSLHDQRNRHHGAAFSDRGKGNLGQNARGSKLFYSIG